MPVLYRDYRPLNFASVINQENIKTTLQKAVAGGFFAHAYLFTGPRGTGKTSVARILARAINCPKQKNGEPCNECEVCKQFLNGSSLDLIEIDAASNTGVENIRDIIEHLKFSPSSAKYKVFIIDEVHMLSKGAFNALLKTLEEPPQHAVFILATTEIYKVPATVISRTQRFDFKKIDNAELLKHLAAVAKKEKIKIDEASLELIVNASEGSVRDALSILDKLSTFDNIELGQAEQLLGITNILAAQRFLDLLASRDAKGALNFLDQLFVSGVDPVQFNRDFLEYLRKVLMLGMGAQINFPLDQSQKNTLEKHAGDIKSSDLLFIIRLFLRANKDFGISPNLELPMEIAAAEACLAASGANTAGSRASNISTNTSAVNETGAVSQAPKTKGNTMKVEAHIKDQEVEVLLDLDSAPQISLEQMRAAWPEIMQQVKLQASSLFAVLRNCELKDIQGNILQLSCKFKFHKESLEIHRNARILLDVLEKAFASKFALKINVEKTEMPDNLETGNAVLEVFGKELA